MTGKAVGHSQPNEASMSLWLGQVMTQTRAPLYRRHRFPDEVISYRVWLYFRFPLSLRMVEELLAARHRRQPRNHSPAVREIRS